MNMEIEDNREALNQSQAKEPEKKEHKKRLCLALLSACGLMISVQSLFLMIYSYPHLIGAIFMIVLLAMSSVIIYV